MSKELTRKVTVELPYRVFEWLEVESDKRNMPVECLINGFLYGQMKIQNDEESA